VRHVRVRVRVRAGKLPFLMLHLFHLRAQTYKCFEPGFG
jgi:hypothetical protein